MSFARKRAFTLVEMVIIVFLLSVGLAGVISALQKWLSFIQQTREQVLAINLAREGIEQLFVVRDSNRRSWAGKKEACWLKIDPLSLQEGNPVICDDDAWMQSGNYILLTWVIGGQQYFVLSGGNLPILDPMDGLDSLEFVYALCIVDGYWTACPGFTGTTTQGRYFRQIQGKWLFRKDVAVLGWEQIFCDNGADIDDGFGDECADDRAKEFRFCSRVAYVGQTRGVVELCSVVTNYAE